MKKRIQEIHRYLTELFAKEEPLLKTIREEHSRTGLHGIPVTPLIGRTLHFLARLCAPHRILEIGTLGGYSTLWLAQALPPDGQLTSLELNPDHAQQARENVKRAGLSEKITIKCGSGHELLLEEEPADLIFLDADKAGYPDYLEPIIERLNPKGLLIADNVIRNSKVVHPRADDPGIEALAEFNRRIAQDERLESIILPTFVGLGGGAIDGLALARRQS